MRAISRVIVRFLDVLVRSRTEFLLARFGAEIIRLPLPSFARHGLFTLNHHPTDRIGDLHRRSLISLESHPSDMEPTIDVRHFVRESSRVVAGERECRPADLARFHRASERRLAGNLVEKLVEMLNVGR